MRKLTLLSFVFLMGLVLLAHPLGAQTYKFKNEPHSPISSSQVTIDRIYVPTNVSMTNIKIGLYVKSVYYSSLRIVLGVPTGEQIVLKAEQAYGTNWYGSIGSPRSYCLFQDGGGSFAGPTGTPPQGTQPNDRPIQPATLFATIAGKRSQGWWTLTVMDTRANVTPYQTGSLEGWQVMFNSVVVEQEVPIYSELKTGSQIVGIMNGVVGTVPNQKNATQMCLTSNGNPGVSPGASGDAYPFIVSLPSQYAGLTVGQTVPGFLTPGRFRVTINVMPTPNFAPAAFTGDIGVYFGKAPSYTPPLQNPPFPANAVGVASQWPIGNSLKSATLLPAAGSPIYGGVRLVACNDNDSPTWKAVNGLSALTVTFDDLALTSINTADFSTPGDPYSDIIGTYKPEQNLALLNGQAVNGLYYVTVYDTYGDNLNVFGHIRVASIQVEYLAGGGKAENQLLHQGVAGPLLGVPVPGVIMNGPPLGYLSDVVGTIPPYSIHSKDQDPVMLFWGIQKLYPRAAAGYERITTMGSTGYNPPAGMLYDGPFAYPSSLQSDPTKAGLSANVDLVTVDEGTYTFRNSISQMRYDDDPSDNNFDSAPVQITPSSLAYYGTKVNQWNYFNAGTQGGLFASFPLQTNGAAASGLGQTFTLFKNPSTKITSIDYKFDVGYVVNTLWRTNLRISIWRCANGFTGAPVGPPVAMSQTIGNLAYMPGNWRSFPIYACDASGAITTNKSVDLGPGTYAVMLDNMSTTLNAMIFPYSYGQMPYLNDRYYDYNFNETFGPIGPYSTHGTRLMYQSTVNALLAPPTGLMSALGTNTFANFALPMRVNMTSLNDFAIDFVAFNSSTGPESISLTGAPFKPSVQVTANSLQGGQSRDYNIRLEIWQGPNRVYLDDMVHPVINQYQTVRDTLATWNPLDGGLYHVKASFSRNPYDQNPVNDVHEFDLYVTTTRAIIVRGAGANDADVNAAIASMKDNNTSYEVLNITDPKLAGVHNIDVVLVGDLSSNDKNTVNSLIANNNNLGFLYKRTGKIGQLLRNVDQAFEVKRVREAAYDQIDLFPTLEERPVNEAPVKISEELKNLKITSKEDLLAMAKSSQMSVTAPEAGPRVENRIPVETMVPVAVGSAFGDVSYVDQVLGDYGIVHAVPSVRKPADQVQEVKAAEGFVLANNYPNPFNPSTLISYTLPEQSVVTLRVLDMLGREVMTLVSETQAAGTYNVNWSGLDMAGVSVASGQYIYRIDATPVSGNTPFSAMKKMTLAK